MPAAHICSITSISKSVGANRIIPAVSIPYPLGDPEASMEEEFSIRRELVEAALESLTEEVRGPTFFKTADEF